MFTKRQVFVERTTTVRVTQHTQFGTIEFTDSVRSGTYAGLDEIDLLLNAAPQLSQTALTMLRHSLIQQLDQSTPSTPQLVNGRR